MTTVSLEGRLGQVIGKNFSFKTRNLREVFSAIEANTGKFRSYLQGNGRRRFAVFVNGKEVCDKNDFNVNVKGKEVLIIPLLMGGLVATSAAITTAMLGSAMVGTVAFKVVNFVVGTVLMAALSFGISLLIAKILKPDDPESLNTSSFIFGQAENITRQGVVVPVGYGRMQIGSRVISVNIVNSDRTIVDNSGANSFNSGSTNTGNSVPTSFSAGGGTMAGVGVGNFFVDAHATPAGG